MIYAYQSRCKSYGQSASKYRAVDASDEVQLICKILKLVVSLMKKAILMFENETFLRTLNTYGTMICKNYANSLHQLAANFDEGLEIFFKLFSWNFVCNFKEQ